MYPTVCSTKFSERFRHQCGCLWPDILHSSISLRMCSRSKPLNFPVLCGFASCCICWMNWGVAVRLDKIPTFRLVRLPCETVQGCLSGILRFRTGDYDGHHLLGCSAMHSGRKVPVFRTNLLQPSSITVTEEAASSELITLSPIPDQSNLHVAEWFTV